MTSNELHVVIGASGGTGSEIVRELIAQGKRVRGVNRSGHANFPFDIALLKADATDPIQMREVCQGAAVVYNCVNPPFTQWRELFPAVMEATIAGAAAVAAKYVFADDTWMYGKVNQPMTEDLPPLIIDSSKYQSAFGEAAVTSYQEGIRQTLNWYRTQTQSGSNQQQSNQNKTNWVNTATLKPLLPRQEVSE